MEKPLEHTDEEREYYSLNRRIYPKFAPFYDVVTLPIRRLRRKVVSLSGAGPRSKILDVATGTGAQAFAFAETGARVIGADLSEAMLCIARRKNRFPNLMFHQADATDLPFADGSFDVACISFALHEMPLSIRERVVRELSRVTRSGGTIVIVDYALPENAAARMLVYHLVKLYERDHYASFVHSDLRALLQRTGIRVQEQRFFVLGAVRILIGSKADAEGEKETGAGCYLPAAMRLGSAKMEKIERSRQRSSLGNRGRKNSAHTSFSIAGIPLRLGSRAVGWVHGYGACYEGVRTDG